MSYAAASYFCGFLFFVCTNFRFFSLKFMLCKIIVYAVFKVRRDSMSLPFRPPTAEHFFFVLAAACSPMPSPA